MPKEKKKRHSPDEYEELKAEYDDLAKMARELIKVVKYPGLYSHDEVARAVEALEETIWD